MVEVITFWQTLLHKAKKLGKARLNGTPEEIKQAESELASYEEMVKRSDKLIL